MKKSLAALLRVVALCALSSSHAYANSGDFYGGVAIGTGYAGVDTAPSNGAIIQGDVGIGSTSPITSLDLSQKTDAIALPVGNTANRPTGAALTNGEMRYNTSTPGVEAYVNGSWSPLGSSSGGPPAGSIIMWAANTPPSGYLECNGAAVSRTTYASLFATIGTTFGSGDGSTTFNLPDMRGYFPRGWSNSGSVDSGRTFGSTQADTVGPHTHSVLSIDTADIGFLLQVGGTQPAVDGFGSSGSTNFTVPANTGTTETRPVNVALMFCIKY